MIFAVLDPSPLTVCINCSFVTFIYLMLSSVLRFEWSWTINASRRASSSLRYYSTTRLLRLSADTTSCVVCDQEIHDFLIATRADTVGVNICRPVWHHSRTSAVDAAAATPVVQMILQRKMMHTTWLTLATTQTNSTQHRLCSSRRSFRHSS